MKGVLCSTHAFQRKVVYQLLVSVYFFHQSQLESLAVEASMCRLGMPQRLGGKGIELTYQAFPMLISPDYFSVTYLLSFSSLASDQQKQMQYKKNLTFLLLLLKFTAVLLGISVRGASFVAQIHVKFCMTIFSNIKYYFQSNFLNPNRPQAAFVQLS